jgi:hypothetical protein
MSEQINPLQSVFTWLCQQNNIPPSNQADAAAGMRGHVANARRLYLQPIGRQLPYHDPHFRAAYLLAYFPYYIEPIFHVLQSAEIPDSLFDNGRLNLALFGGGPCPELLGLAYWLRQRAPQLGSVNALVFDREPGWSAIQEGLIPAMLDDYRSRETRVTLAGHGCDVVECLTRDCSCGVADRDLIVSQNFLTELYTKRHLAISTFERVIQTSRCRYLLFVENRYEAVRELMDNLAADLFSKGLTTKPVRAASSHRIAGFSLPPLLREHLFIGQDGLIPRRNIKYHSMVLEVRR